MIEKHKRKNEFVSPVGWYIASILMRLEWDDEDTKNLNRRCKTWENTILIQAKSPSEAYFKAMKRGGLEEEGEVWEVSNENHKAKWHFEGLTSLLAIYDELGDGAEVIWKEFENRSVKTIKSWVLPKDQLEVFDRSEES